MVRTSNFRALTFLLAASILLAVPGWSQNAMFGVGADGSVAVAPAPSYMLPAHTADVPLVAPPVGLPQMAPELALDTLEQRAVRQQAALAGYSASTVVQAELLDTAQRGEFQLKRRYVAPNTLQFTPVKFTGDGFVKSNVIVRLLQSEVDHVSKGESAQTAINNANYRFSYKGVDQIDGRSMHVFHVKPRQKRPGLFKGRIFVDVSRGMLRRAEGVLVKSPSFFVKKIEFVQDYADVGDFTFPVHMHSEAKTRLFGRAVVDVFTRDYDLTTPASTAPATQTASSSAQPAASD